MQLFFGLLEKLAQLYQNIIQRNRLTSIFRSPLLMIEVKQNVYSFNFVTAKSNGYDFLFQDIFLPFKSKHNQVYYFLTSDCDRARCISLFLMFSYMKKQICKHTIFEERYLDLIRNFFQKFQIRKTNFSYYQQQVSIRDGPDIRFSIRYPAGN